MNSLFEWLSRVATSWKCWVVIGPWDIGVRVRLGKVASTLKPGPHLRIPFLDEITITNTRIRMASTPSVTVAGSKNNTSRTVSATFGFRITDPVAAMMEYAYPDTVLIAVVQKSLIKQLTEDECLDALNNMTRDHGIETVFVNYTENVEVRTFKILNGGGGTYYSSPASAVVSGNGVEHY